MGFVVDAARHTYHLDGRRLDSVTDILVGVGVIDPTFYNAIAASRGKKVHLAAKLLETAPTGLDWASLRPVEDALGGEPVEPYVRGWARFLRETGWRSQLVEHAAYHPEYLYAGTVDRVGAFPDGRPAILDIKTGEVEDWADLQTGGYDEMLPADPGGRLRGRYAVRLKPVGDFEIVPLKDWNAGRIFLSALTCYRWRLQHGRVTRRVADTD